ncbi:MAG: periplasmic heavy metal sensor [Magnetococcales bacterium]|nr:periplasmic heavy metal sensor [Magnetococcales bacterium]
MMPIRPSQWQPWLMAGSLLLNLFLAGVLFGIWQPWNSDQQSPWLKNGPGMMQGWFLPQSDPALATVIDQVWRQHGAHIQQQMQTLQQARQAVHEQLAAQLVDEAALHAAFSQLRRATYQAQESSHHAVLAMAQRLSPEQRRVLANPGKDGHQRRHPGGCGMGQQRSVSPLGDLQQHGAVAPVRTQPE